MGEGTAEIRVERSGEGGGESISCRESGSAEDADLKPRLYRFPVLGGSGGGCSSELRGLAISWRIGFWTVSPERVRLSYFCRMYRSIAASISSTSSGTDGLTFFGL